MSPEAFRAFQDEAHEALRVAHDAIQTASLEAKQLVDKATNTAMLVAYGRIQAAAEKLRDEVQP